MFELLRAVDPPASATEATRQVRAAVKETAARLRNTAAVCRRSYIHPAVIDAHTAGTLQEIRNGRHSSAAREWLSDDELGLMTLLER
jgi:DNA topoisomerase-1